MKLWAFIQAKRWDAWLKPHKIPGMMRELRALRAENKALKRWIHARHVPSIRSVPQDPLKALLRNGKRLITAAILLSCFPASAQRLLYTRYTTNTTPVVDAFVSAGGTNSRQFGTLSLTNLSGNPNVATNILGAGTVTVTSNNAGTWTITGAAGGVTTNENQFLGVPLSIKHGAFLTNMNYWGSGTNHGRLFSDAEIVPMFNETYSLGDSSVPLAWSYVAVGGNATLGVRYHEPGGVNFVSLNSPALASDYNLTWPNIQGADGTTITNDGSGNLGWWDATAVIAQKQFGSANLTNWSNIPTGSMANVASTTFLTNWANSISNYVTAATNSASVTNWINFRQPASENLTNWSNIPTGAMANVVSTDFLTNWANAISNLTQTKTALTTNANQFGASVQLTIKDGALLTNTTFHGTTTLIGPQTNASSVDIAGGQTNWAGMHVRSNLIVTSGQSTSNAWVGGTYWWSTASFTNHTATANATNLATNAIAGNVLTNNGDTIHVQWRIKQANLLVNTNQYQIIYGSQTVLDTGLLPSSNSVCTADLWITRTGNTAQHAEGRFEWGPGSGAPFAFTNTNLELVQTNGIATIFQLRLQARRVGAATNNWTRVWFDPAVR